MTEFLFLSFILAFVPITIGQRISGCVIIDNGFPVNLTVLGGDLSLYRHALAHATGKKEDGMCGGRDSTCKPNPMADLNWRPYYNDSQISVNTASIFVYDIDRAFMDCIVLSIKRYQPPLRSADTSEEYGLKIGVPVAAIVIISIGGIFFHRYKKKSPRPTEPSVVVTTENTPRPPRSTPRPPISYKTPRPPLSPRIFKQPDDAV